MTAPLMGVQLSGSVRIVLSVLGGIFAVAMFESLAGVFMLLRFGLAGSQSPSSIYWASAVAAMLALAGLLAAFAVLASAVARDAWSLRRRWYLPMLLLALAIYGALLLLGLAADPSKLYGEMLDEKRASVGTCLALTAVAVLIGVEYYRRSPR